MGNINRERGTLRKNQKKMIEIKNSVIEMKNVFDSPFGKLDMAKKRICNISTSH